MPELLLFALVAGLGAWFQAVSGFGLGLIVMALADLVAVQSIPVVAAVVSLLAMVNVVTSLVGHVQHVNWGMWRWITFGQVCGIPAGVGLLVVLDQGQTHLLELLLGVFVLAGSASTSWRPHAGARADGPLAMAAAGLGGGVVGGMFAASAPVIGWFGYRQPLDVAAIRATLLACFAVTTLTRTGIVALSGALTPEVWRMAAAALPVVVLVSWLGTRFPPRLSQQRLRRYAFLALAVMGCWITARGLLALAQ